MKSTIVDDGYYFSSSKSSNISQGAFRWIHIPNLKDIKIQYFRVVIVGESATEHLVLSAYPTLEMKEWEAVFITINMMEATASISGIMQREEGLIVAHAVEPIKEMAGALATVAYSASWDESDPIRVVVNGEEFLVRVRCIDKQIELTVTR